MIILDLILHFLVGFVAGGLIAFTIETVFIFHLKFQLNKALKKYKKERSYINYIKVKRLCENLKIWREIK